MNIQSFKMKLVQGKAILLHPLVCSSFNADFDGDQMGVHVPITQQARAEAWKLLWSINNSIGLASRQPLFLPTQDMVIGNFYLTRDALPYYKINQGAENSKSSAVISKNNYSEILMENGLEIPQNSQSKIKLGQFKNVGAFRYLSNDPISMGATIEDLGPERIVSPPERGGTKFSFRRVNPIPRKANHRGPDRRSGPGRKKWPATQFTAGRGIGSFDESGPFFFPDEPPSSSISLRPNDSYRILSQQGIEEAYQYYLKQNY